MSPRCTKAFQMPSSTFVVTKSAAGPAFVRTPELNYSKPSVPLDLMIFWYAKKLSLRRRS